MTFTYADLHRWNAEILSVSQSTGVPANVLKAIMWVESRGMLNARSPLTAYGYYFGLMQVGPTSSVPEYMKSVTWMCDNAYNQVLAGGTEMVNKAAWIGSNNWIEVAGAYFGYGTDVTGTTTSSYMQQFANHATQLIGTTPGGTDWTPPPLPTPTTSPPVYFAIGSTISVDSDTLNMRNNPGLSTTITRVLLFGESGTVLEGPNRKDNFDWYRIRLSNNSTGWVAGQFMRPSSDATRTPTGQAGTPTRTPTPGGSAGAGFVIGDHVTVNTFVNFRTSPGYAGAIMRALPVGTTGTVIGVGRTVDGLHWSNVRLGDNSTGWIASDFIDRTSTSTATPTRTPTKPPATTTTTPSPTVDGSGAIYRTITRLNLRESPSTGSAILATLPTGKLATSLGNTATANGYSWLRVQVGSLTGWVATNYLANTGTTAGTSSPTATRTPNPTQTTSPAGNSGDAGTIYRVITLLNLRQSPSTGSAILTTLPTGTLATSLGNTAAANGYSWLRVQVGPLAGWVATNYLANTGTTAGTSSPTATRTPNPTQTTSPAGNSDDAGMVYRNTVRLNIRQAPSTSGAILGTLATGTTMISLGDSIDANGHTWLRVQAGPIVGWLSTRYIEATGATASTPTGVATLTRTPTITPTPTSTPPFATATRTANGYITGDIVKVIDGPLNYRSAAGTSSGILGTLTIGVTGMVLNGPAPADGFDWYELQIGGRPNGWVAGDFLTLVSASVVNGSDGLVESVGNTIPLTDTPAVTITATAPADEQIGQTGPTASPTETAAPAPGALPTGEAPAETVAPVEPPFEEESAVPSETTVPTEPAIPTEIPLSPAETPVPPTSTSTSTSTPTPTPTLPPDADGDGIADALDACPGVADSGSDTDADGLDDACDPTPLGEPTLPPVVERSFDVYAAADTSVSQVDPSAAQPGDQAGTLPVGGETGGIAYLTFFPDQIGSGQVQSAVLYLTGMSGSGPVSISVVDGVAIDEYALTLDTAPGGSWAADAWVDAGIVVPVDLTGWITADGPVTIIVSGDGVSLGSRDGGAPAYLSITVLDTQ